MNINLTKKQAFQYLVGLAQLRALAVVHPNNVFEFSNIDSIGDLESNLRNVLEMDDLQAEETHPRSNDCDDPRHVVDEIRRDEEEGDEDLRDQAIHSIFTTVEVDSEDLAYLPAFGATLISSSLGNPSDKVKINFESSQHNRNVIYTTITDLDGKRRFLPTHFIRREAKKIFFGELLESGIVWHSFFVTKFNPDLAAVLPLGDIVKVLW